MKVYSIDMSGFRGPVEEVGQKLLVPRRIWFFILVHFS